MNRGPLGQRTNPVSQGVHSLTHLSEIGHNLRSYTRDNRMLIRYTIYSVSVMAKVIQPKLSLRSDKSNRCEESDEPVQTSSLTKVHVSTVRM